jgi:hypothetical protein
MRKAVRLPALSLARSVAQSSAVQLAQLLEV